MADDPTPPAAERRYFSLEEANRLVPELETRFRRIRARIERIREVTGHLSSLGGAHPGSLRADLQRVYREIEVDLTTVRSLGCVVKDLAQGLVDFWHRQGGEEVLLCWKLGEETIAYFHDEESGFQGRRPIEELGSDGLDGAEDGSIH